MDRQIVWQGRFLRAVVRGRYECIERCNISGIVGIIAVTDEGELVLVEQFRPPLQARVIELPAGLVGDTDAGRDESLETAAHRELMEETGYVAASIEPVACGAASAGMSNETMTLMLARGLTRTAAGGGDEHEDITVHHVPLKQLLDWLRRRTAEGILVDLKVYAAIPFCQ
ncbi:MAG: NUDIX hydrolase [Planctomycetaceae bacterium]|nr:NUDIX hydrolase [Planctomycetaceae bacterium]